MSRELQNAEEEPRLDAEAAPPVTPAAKVAISKAPMLGGLTLKKWDGKKESLEPAKYGKAGKNGAPKFLKPGAEQHFLVQAGHRRFKLMAIRRNRGGVQTRLLAMLRDNKSFPGAQSVIVRLKKDGFLR